MATFGEVMDRAAAALNDVNKRTYTYAVQLPYCKMAWDDLEGLLHQNDIPVVKEKSAVVVYTALAETVTSPSDLVLPLDLMERDRSSTDDGSWIPMTRQNWDTNTEPTPYLSVWNWREQGIVVPPCTRDRDVQIRYIKDISSSLANENSTITVGNAVQFLGFKTAYYIAAFLSRDDERASLANDEAGRAEGMIMDVLIKDGQFRSVRRKPYRARR